VINAIQLDGMRKSEAAQILGISRNTIDLWLKQQQATGSLLFRFMAKTYCFLAKLC